MEPILLACDLDNTLLHSHRRKKDGDICVEWFEGREQSFLDPAAYALLPRAVRELRLVPVTTRSVEQYRRIRWPEGCVPDLALAANGAVLLRDGQPDPGWHGTDCVRPYLPELDRLLDLLLEEGGHRACRIVDGAYLFAAYDGEDAALRCARSHPTSLVTAVSGRKVYFLPPEVNKGCALRRLQAILHAPRVLAAGDSSLDLPMLNAAHLALVPDAHLAAQVRVPVKICPENTSFARFILETALFRNAQKPLPLQTPPDRCIIVGAEASRISPLAPCCGKHKEDTIMKNIISTTAAPAAIGPYSQGIDAGSVVFTSGQLPIDPATGAFAEGGVAEQTRQSLKNVQAVLAQAGLTMGDIVKTTVFLKSMDDFAAMNTVYAEFFQEAPPARSAVEVARLPKDALVEIEAVAVRSK